MKPVLTLLAITFGLFSFGVVGIWATAFAADDTKIDLSKLEGTYSVTAGEENGKALPPEKLKGSIIIITRDTIVGTDKDMKQFFSCGYSLDVNTRPVRIKMVVKEPNSGTEATGIIEVAGDTVRICYQLPGGEVPSEFKTKDKQNFFSLKRVK